MTEEGTDVGVCACVCEGKKVKDRSRWECWPR